MCHEVTTNFFHVVIVIDFKLNDLKHSGESGMNLTYDLLLKLQVLDSPQYSHQPGHPTALR